MEPVEYNAINCNEFFDRMLSEDPISKDFWKAKIQTNKLFRLNIIFDEINSYYEGKHYGY